MPANLPDRRLAFRVEELPALLGIGRTSAYKLANQIGRRVGRSLIVPRAALEAWLAGSSEAQQ